MWKKALFAGLVASFFVLAPQAFAAVMVGSIDATASSMQTALSSISTTQTSLNTALSSNDPMAIRYGNYIFYTDRVGLRRAIVGTTTVKTLRSSTVLNIVASRKQWLIVSNNKVSGSAAGSFVYDMKAKKFTALKPIVGQIYAADLSDDGKVAVISGKDTKGKNKLWLSQGNIATVKSFTLPNKAQTCLGVSVSPKGTMVTLLCQYSTGFSRMITLPINGQTFGTAQVKFVSTFAPFTIEMLNEQRLIVGGVNIDTAQANPFVPVYKYYRLNSQGKFSGGSALAIDTTSYAPAGETGIISAPYQIRRVAVDRFFYEQFVFGTLADSSTIYKGAIGYYNLTTNHQTDWLTDSLFNYLTEEPFTGSTLGISSLRLEAARMLLYSKLPF